MTGPASPPHVPDYLRSLREQAEGAADASQVLALLEETIQETSRYSLPRGAAYDAVLRHAPFLDARVFDRAHLLDSPLALQAMWENGRLPEATQQELARLGLLTFLEEARSLRHQGGDTYLFALRGYALGWLREDDPETRRAWKTLRSLSRMVSSGSLDPQDTNGAEEYLSRLAQLLLVSPSLPSPRLLDLVQQAGPLLRNGRLTGTFVASLSEHPACTLEVLLATCEEAPLVPIVCAVAHHRGARREARVREHLRAHLGKSPDVLALLCLEAEEETRPLFLRLMAEDLATAARVLEDSQFEGLEHLRVEDLAPLLSSAHHHHRLAALRGLARLSQARGLEAAPPAQSTSAGARGARRQP